MKMSDFENNFVNRIKTIIIEEMKQLCGDVLGVNWNEVSFDDATNIDWVNNEIEVYFFSGNEHPIGYKFCHDYKQNRGCFLVDNKERKPENYKLLKIWGNWNDGNEQ